MRTVYREFVMRVPERLEPRNDDEHAALGEAVGPIVTEAVRRRTAKDVGHPFSAITTIAIVVTCKLELIDSLPFAEDCKDKGGCADCLRGRDWAKTYLMEHPGLHLVIGTATIEVPTPL